MRCQHAKDLISLSLDVDMPEFERSRLVTHLATRKFWSKGGS